MKCAGSKKRGCMHGGMCSLLSMLWLTTFTHGVLAGDADAANDYTEPAREGGRELILCPVHLCFGSQLRI